MPAPDPRRHPARPGGRLAAVTIKWGRIADVELFPSALAVCAPSSARLARSRPARRVRGLRGARHLGAAALLLLLIGAPALGCVSPPRPQLEHLTGVVVEGVVPEGVAARAGIQVGDLLLSWRQGDRGGALQSPFDLDRLNVEDVPRGVVTFDGRRGESTLQFELEEGSWGLEVLPRLGLRRDRLLADGLQAGGVGRIERLRALAREEERPAVRAWLLLRAAQLAAPDSAEELWAEVADSVREEPAVRVWVDQRLGEALLSANRYEEAAAVFSRALDGRSEASLTAAASLHNLGIATRAGGDLEAAEAYLSRALEIREQVAPGSLAVAATLNNLGVVSWSRGDLEAAEGFHRRALEIKERLAPDSLAVAGSLSNLGNAEWSRGDLEAAERHHRQALALFGRLAPGSLDVAKSLTNLGSVACDRADLAAAEGYYRRALGLFEQLAPGSLAVAASLNNLGVTAEDRGDLEAANAYYGRALEIREQLAPGGLAVAASLNNLGNIAFNRGDLETAESLDTRALEIRERLAHGSLDVAVSLSNLGSVARQRGDLAAAERYHRRALEIRQNLAPGSTKEVVSLRNLARVLRSAGRRSEALDTLRRAVAALETQQRRLGGTAEQLGEFRAQHLGIYYELIDLLLEEGLPEEAFGVLESARARSLLALLAERDMVGSDAPVDLERERRLANADHDRTMAALGQLTGADEEERVRLLAALDTIRQRQEQIRARVRSASPRLAELRYPEPLDLDGTRQALDSGTLLLAYAVGEQKSHLFVVGPEPEQFAVHSLPIGEGELREQVARARRLIQREGDDQSGPVGEASRDVLNDVLRSLYVTLVGPASTSLFSCSRVTVVPDGPLHLLPVAALIDPAASDGQYLVELKPLSVVASATVLAQLEERRRPPRETRLVAFGDPSYRSPSAKVSPQLGQAVRSGDSLAPLPATRIEVEGLGQLFAGHATLWLGPEATEERAKAVGEGVTIVHFAAHGLIDGNRPLSSALALSIPEQVVEGQENGFLQAWEVFEQVRLDADLVTLSACETALGQELAGEGILGLTRAFQYAGARSVLASLWSVADQSTAELMGRFYGNLNAGMAKDEALRQAQRELIRAPVEIADGVGEVRLLDATRPLHWGAFQVIGDWQ